MNESEIMQAAVDVVSGDALSTAGKNRVRVTRVLVYEGPADEVRRLLSKSLPVGVRDGVVSVDVYQGAVVPVEAGSR